jgi:hypothetical protein
MPDGIVRPHVVVLVDEGREAPLLGAERGRRGPGGLSFEDRVKLFMRAVVAGATGASAFREDLEAQPPHGQPREPGQARGAEGRAIVRANPLG